MTGESPVLGIIIMAGAVPAILFPFLYAWKSRWWSNSGGRLIMSLSSIIAIFYAILVIFTIWGRDIFIDQVWFDVFRAAAITFATGALWYQLIVYIQIAFGSRKDNDHD